MTAIVAIWCNECEAIRGPNGERLLYGGKPSTLDYRCGVDYGPDRHSHLDVVPLGPVESGSTGSDGAA